VRVQFRQLTDTEIEHYLRTEQPYDCAGSAKCETLGIALLDAIHSDDPTALVGLPLIRTSHCCAQPAWTRWSAAGMSRKPDPDAQRAGPGH
jgi:predicted house-cleaning NTP pyrophosphatase (Maf/HAM1 superfamily)